MTDVKPLTDEPTDGAPGCGCGLVRLLEQSAAGDRQAFAALYDATSDRSFGLAAAVLGDDADAERVTRETYLHLWAHPESYDATRGTPVSWILTAVHRRAVALLHAEDQDASVVGPGEGGDRRAVGRSAPTDAAESSASRDAQSALGGLSQERREAVELAWFGGLTCSEVACVTGASLATTRTAVRDGLRELGHRTTGPS